MSYYNPAFYPQQPSSSSQPPPSAQPQASFRGMHQLVGAPTPPLNSLSAFGSGGIGGPMHAVPQPQRQQQVPSQLQQGGDGMDVDGAGGDVSRRESEGGLVPAGGATRANSGSSTGGTQGAGGAGADAAGGFDFTKRKRWQSLLLTELTDTIVMALLPLSNGGAKILYSSPGVKQLLGYEPKDLEQRPLSEFVYEPDLAPLLNNLHQSVLNRTDLASYHRFLPKSLQAKRRSTAGGSGDEDGSGEEDHGEEEDDADGSDSDGSDARIVTRKPTTAPGAGGPGGRPVLLELRGHGYWGEEAERVPLPLSIVQGLPQSSPSGGSGSAAGERCKCFFLMARKWPSKTGEMLDSFLEEKMENERLRAEMLELAATGHFTREEVEEYKLNVDPEAARSHSIPGLPSSYSAYPSHPTPAPPALAHHSVSASSSASSNNYYDAGEAYYDDDSDPDRKAYVPPKKSAAASSTAARKPPPAPGADGTEVGQKKKPKKSKAAKSGRAGDVNHVCVTCGRTDSPEWRRGPMGPKTLCNSCGLRWKKAQKAENGGV